MRWPSLGMHATFSPDGRFIAYGSDESSTFEVYAQTFPLSDRKLPISVGGGSEPRWRADGREIYYLSDDRKLMAVDVGPGPSFGVPRALFQTRVATGFAPTRTNYAPSRDGQRFLINTCYWRPRAGAHHRGAELDVGRGTVKVRSWRTPRAIRSFGLFQFSASVRRWKVRLVAGRSDGD
jgi:hypothetical protein